MISPPTQERAPLQVQHHLPVHEGLDNYRVVTRNVLSRFTILATNDYSQNSSFCKCHVLRDVQSIWRFPFLKAICIGFSSARRNVRHLRVVNDPMAFRGMQTIQGGLRKTFFDTSRMPSSNDQLHECILWCWGSEEVREAVCRGG